MGGGNLKYSQKISIDFFGNKKGNQLSLSVFFVFLSRVLKVLGLIPYFSLKRR